VKTSLSGHDLHGLAHGPDGKVYFSMGDRGYNVTTREGKHLVPPIDPGRGAVFRMNPDGSGLEVFAEGLRNPQELAFDDYGNLFTGDNNGDGGDKARIVYVVEGGDSGWAMPYQTLVGDYLRGQWNAEKLWHLQHETQPAWIVPPIGHLANGPSGLAYYPGLGLPERFAGRFFLCDYRYQPSKSQIWSFGVEPAGAGFRGGRPRLRGPAARDRSRLRLRRTHLRIALQPVRGDLFLGGAGG
jgi:quinoprotein glucose dehydrogenase